ncbi:MAG: substrate-binding domain-containing protein, partial [Mycobacterium sp.]|nr:substrate-binding domain-containing protein [Mycobacterium sp.]
LIDTDESAEREERALRSALATGVAGILLYPVEGRSHPATLAELRRHEIPIVMIDRYRQDVVTDAVLVDNVDAGYQVTRHLISLGHHCIATLWSETDCSSVQDRLAGHLRALRDAGLRTRPEFTVLQRYWPTTHDHRRRHLQRLLELPEPPTALLCANGYVLAAAAHDLVTLGVDVPNDIDIAGMDSAGP